VVTGHLEIETKYDVDDRFVVPDLAGLSAVSADEPVEHLLEAVYHDTADLRLLRAGVTLRRRTGGPDAGWHLKLPAGRGRRELFAPLGRAVKKPPRALVAPLAGILRGAPTAPVVALRTRRVVTVLRDPDGRAVAEVADDTVTATGYAAAPDEPTEVHAWREVEVELASGAAVPETEAVAAAVGASLLAAGARPSAASSKVGRVLAGRLAAQDGQATDDGAKRGKGRPTAGEFLVGALRGQVAALQAADLLLRTDQPDAVHQLRVTGRRMRSILAAFRGVLDEQETTRLHEELSWLGQELAAVRDDEVALAHLRALVHGEPQELVLGPVAARVQQTQLRAEVAGRERALATVSEVRYLRLLDALHALVDEAPFAARAGEPARAVLRDGLGRSARRLRRRLAAAREAAGPQRAEQLHGVRKAAKRVRYVGEIARGEVKGTKRLVRAAEGVQELLGEAQDTVVTREHCRRLGIAAAAAGENSFTYGRLHALEQTRAARAEERFWAAEPELRRLLDRATT
jgi:CHAD domain-containing protein